MCNQILNGLRASVFSQLERILGKIWHHVAVAVPHAKKDIDRGSRLFLRRGPARLGCLCCRMQRQQQRGNDGADYFDAPVSHGFLRPAHPILPNDELSFNSREALRRKYARFAKTVVWSYCP